MSNRLVTEAAVELADQIESSKHDGLVLIRDRDTGAATDVFISGDGDNMLATVASALDENPTLIGLFIAALTMVRRGGNSKDDPGFAPVIFAHERAN